jgi:hypothetical protein
MEKSRGGAHLAGSNGVQLCSAPHRCVRTGGGRAHEVVGRTRHSTRRRRAFFPLKPTPRWPATRARDAVARRGLARGMRMHARRSCTRCRRGSEAESPGARHGPQRCLRGNRTPEQGVHGMWQAWLRTVWRALWFRVQRRRQNNFGCPVSKLHNFRKCQLSEKSPKIKVVEEL